MATTRTDVWQWGTVVDARWVATSIRRIEIAVDSPVAIDPGAHIDVRLTIDGTRDRRSYSVVDSSADGATLAVSVYQTAVSRGGAAIMHALRPGDRIELTQPLNNFPLRLGAPRYVVLAGGVGVTAISSMARRLRAVGADYRFIYAGRSRDAMAYLTELKAEHGERLEVHVGDEDTSLKVQQLIGSIDEQTELYLCGPIRLMDAVRRSWIEAGLPMAHLRMETFGNSGWHDPEKFTVTIPATGISVQVSPSQSMLEALQAAGADMMYDCRKGECGLCEVRVIDLDGDIDHRDVFYSERQKDARSKLCCCVSRVVASAGGSRGTATIVIEPS